MKMRTASLIAVAALVTIAAPGCSIRRFAINKIGDALASGGSTYQSDDDIELVGGALPFGLKMIEGLLAEAPRHKGLLLAACQGFTGYAHVYVRREADRAAEEDLERAWRLRDRARRLYLRGHQYCLTGLEVSYAGLPTRITMEPAAADIVKKKDVPLLYWTAASLGLAISVSKDNAAMLARLPEVEALLDRALRLDESWQSGALHEFQVTFSASRPGQTDANRTETAYRRALDLSQGSSAGLFVSYAEAVPLARQDRAEFRALLEKALAVDPDRHKDSRLTNLVAQQRARWLLERIDDLILEAEKPATTKGENR